jgi:hypothetical protein
MMLYRQFATQEEIDKEYDVENSAPDFQRTPSSTSRAKRDSYGAKVAALAG